ncbi:MAG: hypothetical protein RMY36_009920 [Nostoc sp. SerVER01]|nr:hypothetical protein [Nostoc sp. DcaGUA01]
MSRKNVRYHEITSHEFRVLLAVAGRSACAELKVQTRRQSLQRGEPPQRAGSLTLVCTTVMS